jgi:hypothetical protein
MTMTIEAARELLSRSGTTDIEDYMKVYEAMLVASGFDDHAVGVMVEEFRERLLAGPDRD